MPRDLHPSDGARYLLDRDGPGDGAQVRYRAAIYTRDAEFATTALLDDAGGADLGPSGAPDELHARLLHLCRLVARDAAPLRADGLPPPPPPIPRRRRR